MVRSLCPLCDSWGPDRCKKKKSPGMHSEKEEKKRKAEAEAEEQEEKKRKAEAEEQEMKKKAEAEEQAQKKAEAEAKIWKSHYYTFKTWALRKQAEMQKKIQELTPTQKEEELQNTIRDITATYHRRMGEKEGIIKELRQQVSQKPWS